LGDEISQAVLNDWRSAPIDKKLRAALKLIEKLTQTPDQIESSDMDTSRAEGLSDEAIEDAIHVTVLFNIIDRIADSFGFEIPSASGFAGMAEVLLKRGY
jgi:alkylhydroperoxidase family enzyme